MVHENIAYLKAIPVIVWDINNIVTLYESSTKNKLIVFIQVAGLAFVQKDLVRIEINQLFLNLVVIVKVCLCVKIALEIVTILDGWFLLMKIGVDDGMETQVLMRRALINNFKESNNPTIYLQVVILLKGIGHIVTGRNIFRLYNYGIVLYMERENSL